jgi:membrane protease YdiL (CAAX protease family)
MTDVVRRFPAFSLFVLSSLLALLPIVLVAAGVLPPSFSQLGALSASAAGIMLAAVEGRKGSVKELFKRGIIWRVGVGWWAFALFFTFIVSLSTLAAFNQLTGQSVRLGGIVPVYDIFSMVIILTIFAGFGEEFGWRGYLLPRLQIRHTALTASLIIGAFHTLWHLPMFFMVGQTQYSWVQDIGFFPALFGYGVFVTAWAIQYTWVFNNTDGSVLLSAVVHGVGNAWIGGYFDIHGRTGIAGSLIMTSLMALASLLIVIFAGPVNLSRSRARQTLDASADQLMEAER